MKLYFVEYRQYRGDGIWHAFTMAKSKADASKGFDTEVLAARPATDEDIKEYGRGRSREEIIAHLEGADVMIRRALHD